MTYPHIFVNGSCDITIKKIRSDYLQWVEHIYFTTDNRVAAHPFLKFQLLNIGLKKRALNQGSYLVSQQLNEALLTVDELKENLNNDDDSVPRKIISFAGSLPNTDPYWRERKKELDSLHFFLMKEYQVMPTYFDTCNCAEHHWTPLHQLLIKYYAAVTNQSEGDIVGSYILCRLCRQYADAILHNARSIGLQATYDKATPTDGNCFYHAVVESLSYYGINFQGTHLSLRMEVVNYVRQNENLAFVQTYILTLPEKESFLHATELFVFATAMYLSIFILVTMEISNGENPYVIHYPN